MKEIVACNALFNRWFFSKAERNNDYLMSCKSCDSIVIFLMLMFMSDINHQSFDILHWLPCKFQISYDVMKTYSYVLQHDNLSLLHSILRFRPNTQITTGSTPKPQCPNSFLFLHVIPSEQNIRSSSQPLHPSTLSSPESILLTILISKDKTQMPFSTFLTGDKKPLVCI